MTQTQQDQIINSLIDRQITISTMESCTSGMIASMITDTSGASAVFPGGFVTYLNETKVFAGVDEKIIKEYGVYSGECAKAMAETVREKLNTDIGIGITGTTGNLDPKSGSEVMEMLCDLRAKMNKTLIVITHDPDIAEMAERRFTIIDGVLSEVTVK